MSRRTPHDRAASPAPAGAHPIGRPGGRRLIRLPGLPLLRRASGLLVCLAAVGCGGQPPPAKPVEVKPKVGLAKVETRTVTRTVGQPGFIYAYEQTSIYPKVSGYVQKWNVDIGDRIKKDQEIATLYDPELDAELLQKKAQGVLDEQQIKVAERMVEVASNNLKAAAAHVQEAQANVNKFQASVERWESEVKRLGGLSGDGGVVDQQVVEESRKQLKADVASRDAAKATVAAAEADQLARQADLEKARADVDAARAKAQVSAADERRVAALVGYTHVTAPYDGVVVVRNANVGDYIQPGTGDESGAGQAARTPLYVVARTDKVRVYVDVPEADANAVTVGTKATVRVQALHDEDFPSAVTRTSWALRPESRTLRAEIDLPNPKAQLLPGMYAYGRVVIDRSDVRAVPLGAVVEIGNQDCCYLYEDGRAAQTPVQTGINDGKWIEVDKKRVKGEWIDFSGDEDVIIGDLSELTDGQPVELSGGGKGGKGP